MDLPSVVKQAAQLLDASFEEEAHAFFLTVTVTETEDEDEDDRTQLVGVELDEEGELVVVSTDVGPWSEEHDLAEVLRLMRDALFSHVYLSEGTEDEPEQIVVEAAIVAEKADPELMASVIQEVAEIADEIELMLFDSEDEGLDDEDEEDGVV
ncbi:MAG: hypothetical protein HYV09_14110 [Deltaproteobacteria bacterium]|nr:hypothetical protein [Deltaproteobacteria bacterium]